MRVRPPWAGRALAGLTAFGAVTVLGLVIALVEALASGAGARPWTWVRVAFLYVAGSCGVTLHVHAAALVPRPLTGITLRVPLMTGTALVTWILFRAGRQIAVAEGLWPMRVSAGAATVIAFGVPATLVGLVASLHLSVAGGVAITPDRVGLLVLPTALGAVGVAAGILSGRNAAAPRSLGAGALGGGWRMWWVAMALAFVAFLFVAAVEPGRTAAYVHAMRGAGRAGAFTVAHHALLLPNQSVWVVAASMGGTTEVAIDGRGATAIRLGSGIARAYYLLLSVPTVASLAGGRHAARGLASRRDRAIRGAAAGMVFTALMGSAAWFSWAVVPLVLPGVIVGTVSIRAQMPSTMALAAVWGVAGGAAGALWPWPRAKSGAEPQPVAPD